MGTISGGGGGCVGRGGFLSKLSPPPSEKVSTLKSKFFTFTVDPFLDGVWVAGTQTGRH